MDKTKTPEQVAEEVMKIAEFHFPVDCVLTEMGETVKLERSWERFLEKIVAIIKREREAAVDEYKTSKEGTRRCACCNNLATHYCTHKYAYLCDVCKTT